MIEIRISDEQDVLIDLELKQPRALIGSGAYCDIRPDHPGLEQEALTIELVSPGELVVENRSDLSHPTFNGEPFERAELGEGGEFWLGRLKLEVRLPKPDTSVKKNSPLRMGLLAVFLLSLVGLAGKVILGGRLAGAARTPRPPVLFPADHVSVCPESDPASAGAAASDILFEADSRNERGPFDPADAVKAAQLFGTGAACLEVAGDPTSAKKVKRTEVVLKYKLAKAYHVHQVRLGRALANNDTPQATLEIQLLKAYLGDRDDPYGRHLDSVGRRLRGSK